MLGLEGAGPELAPVGRRLAARARCAARAGGDLCQPALRRHLLPGLGLALSGANPSPRCHGQRARQDAQGRLRVSAAARLAGDSARAPTPGPLPLDARLVGIPPSGSPLLLRPAF